MPDYRRLKVWRHAHELALAIHRVTASFPDDDGFGVGNDLRRAIVAVAGGLAFGCGFGTPVALARAVQVAMQSAAELEYSLILARDLELLDHSTHEELDGRTTELRRRLSALHTRLRGPKSPPLYFLPKRRPR
jgi:four helix bundle protein